MAITLAFYICMYCTYIPSTRKNREKEEREERKKKKDSLDLAAGVFTMIIHLPDSYLAFVTIILILLLSPGKRGGQGSAGLAYRGNNPFFLELEKIKIKRMS